MRFEYLSCCTHCGARTRVGSPHLAAEGKCAACLRSLAPVAEPLDVRTVDFDEILDHTRVPILVEFWTSWCKPCMAAAPEIRELARSVQGRALVLKVDADANPLLVARYGVQAVPHLTIFQDGQAVLSRPGFAKRAEMREWLEDFISSPRLARFAGI